MIIVLTNSCLFFIQAELMGVNPGVKRRRFLNEDAVPTIFCFTEEKHQRKLSVKRDEIANKKRVSFRNYNSTVT